MTPKFFDIPTSKSWAGGLCPLPLTLDRHVMLRPKEYSGRQNCVIKSNAVFTLFTGAFMLETTSPIWEAWLPCGCHIVSKSRLRVKYLWGHISWGCPSWDPSLWSASAASHVSEDGSRLFQPPGNRAFPAESPDNLEQRQIIPTESKLFHCTKFWIVYYATIVTKTETHNRVCTRWFSSL